MLIEKLGFPRAASGRIRAEVEKLGIVAEPAEVTPVPRDPDDDHVLAAAVAGHAEAIVTGDQELLELGSHKGIAIVSPSAFFSSVGG